MEKKEKILSEEKIFRGVLLDVRKFSVELPNGRRSVREMVFHPGAVAMLPVDDEGNVYLVRQYRFPVDKELLEVPAGKFDTPDEEPLECGKRELEEEIGKKAKRWEYLGYIYTTPGFSNEIIHLYYVSDLEEAQLNPDEDEIIDVVKMSLKEFELKIKNGDIVDAKTLACFAYAKARGLIP